MDEDDEDLSSARNAPLPEASGYSKHLQPKSIHNLNAAYRTLTGELRLADGKTARSIATQHLKEVGFHLLWMESLGKVWDQHLAPLLEEPESGWSHKSVQEAVMKTVKTMWKKHKLPLHVVVSKVHNRWSTSRKKMPKVPETDSKRSRDYDGEAHGTPAKKPRSQKNKEAQDKTKGSKVVSASKDDSASKGGNSGKRGNAGKGGAASKGGTASKESGKGKGSGRSQGSSLRGKSASTRVPKIGSDKALLAVGGCILGDPAFGKSLARGSIVNLSPTIRGYMVDNHEMPYDDYVLARFLTPVSGKENDKLVHAVFEVSSPMSMLSLSRTYRVYSNCGKSIPPVSSECTCSVLEVHFKCSSCVLRV